MAFLRSSSLAPALALLFLVLFAPALATHLHIAGPGDSPSVLRGASLVTDAKSGTPNVVMFSARLADNVVLWDDLLQDGVRITGCARNARKHTAHIVLSGEAVDSSDYAKGTAFVINVEDWEKHCKEVRPASGVDRADDALFYRIKKVIVKPGRVRLALTIVSGRIAVPTVDITVRKAPADMPAGPRRVVYEGDEMYSKLTSSAALVRAVAEDSLDVSARPTFSFNRDVNLFDGADLSVSASVSATVNRFKVVRLFKTKVQWQQSLKASASAELTVTKTFEESFSQEIFKRPIPNLGFSVRIPFIGRIGAGAFVGLNFVADLEVGAEFVATFNAAHETRQRVDARVIPPSLKTTNLLPKGQGSSGGSTFTFSQEGQISVGVTGFVGVRPTVSVEIELGRRGVAGILGASIGLEASVMAQAPPFPALTGPGNGLLLGSCDSCHFLEGALAIKGKDLSLEIEVNSKVVSELTLIETLFEIKLGTLCAIQTTCPVMSNISRLEAHSTKLGLM